MVAKAPIPQFSSDILVLLLLIFTMKYEFLEINLVHTLLGLLSIDNFSQR